MTVALDFGPGPHVPGERVCVRVPAGLPQGRYRLVASYHERVEGDDAVTMVLEGESTVAAGGEPVCLDVPGDAPHEYAWERGQLAWSAELRQDSRVLASAPIVIGTGMPPAAAAPAPPEPGLFAGPWRVRRALGLLACLGVLGVSLAAIVNASELLVPTPVTIAAVAVLFVTSLLARQSPSLRFLVFAGMAVAGVVAAWSAGGDDRRDVVLLVAGFVAVWTMAALSIRSRTVEAAFAVVLCAAAVFMIGLLGYGALELAKSGDLAALVVMFGLMGGAALLGAGLAFPLARLFPAADPTALRSSMAIFFLAGPGLPLVVSCMTQISLFDDFGTEPAPPPSPYGGASFLRVGKEVVVCTPPNDFREGIVVQSSSRPRKVSVRLPKQFIYLDLDGVICSRQGRRRLRLCARFTPYGGESSTWVATRRRDGSFGRLRRLGTHRGVCP